MQRLDIIVAEKINTSRQIAKDLILEGLVCVNGKTITKYGAKITPESNITVEKKDLFVSRSGFKLKEAIDAFGITIKDKICLDVGASTGGFTDCLLKYGARKVYAIDTGYSQLHHSLLDDPRIVSMEKTNINDVKNLDDIINILVIDVSFVSLKKVFESSFNLISLQSDIVCLIKPQFEVGPKNVTKNGVVKDGNLHKVVIDDFYTYFKNLNFIVKGLIKSPILGTSGNVEYLIYVNKCF